MAEISEHIELQLDAYYGPVALATVDGMTYITLQNYDGVRAMPLTPPEAEHAIALFRSIGVHRKAVILPPDVSEVLIRG